VLRPIILFPLLALQLGSACGSDAKPVQAIDSATSACTGSSAEELMPCVEMARLSSDIDAVAIERVPNSAGWQSVQDLCKNRLEEYGYQVELANYATGTNVLGRRAGTDVAAGEVIVSSHYDHIAGCAGADDNATGIAATLEIARLLASRRNRHTLVIACWDEEESGLIGSRAYADSAKATDTDIRAVFSFDGIGFISSEPNSQTVPAGFEVLFPDQVAELEAREFRGDYISLIADEASTAVAESFAAHGDSVGLITSVLPVPEALKLISQTADLRRSDHASFWVHDYPGVMVTDSANFRNPNYHCLGGMDLPGTLDMDFVTQVTQATLGAAIDALDTP